jgi:hypothetical protein
MWMLFLGGGIRVSTMHCEFVTFNGEGVKAD